MNPSFNNIEFEQASDPETSPLDQHTQNDTVNSSVDSNQHQNTSLPPLPSQKIRQKPRVISENQNQKTVQINTCDSFHADNVKRLDKMVKYNVPRLCEQSNSNPNPENYQDFDGNSNEQDNFENRPKPVIRNKVSVKKAIQNNNGSNKVAMMNTNEPSALYANAGEESSPDATPAIISPKNANEESSTELVVTSGFVVHDKKFQTNPQNNNNNNNNNNNKNKMNNNMNDGDVNNNNISSVSSNSKQNSNNISSQQSGRSSMNTQRRQKMQDEERRRSEELESAKMAMNDYLQNNTIPPIELQPQVCGLLKTELVNAMINQDYDRAAEIENASNLLSTAYEYRESELRKQEMQQSMTIRLDTIKKTYETETQEWQRIFNVFHQQQQEQKNQLIAAHEEEMRDFENKWNDSNHMIKFNKPSPGLLNLRKIQKKLAISRQFGEAKRVKISADNMQMEESENAKKRAEATMMNEYNALVEKQNKEIQCFNDHQKWTEQFLKNEQRKIFQPLEMQMKQLTNAINKDKPTNLKPQTITFLSTTKSRVVRTKKIIPPTSPRTFSAYTIFKHEEDAPKLTVNGLDVRKIIGKKRAASAVRARMARNGYE